MYTDVPVNKKCNPQSVFVPFLDYISSPSLTKDDHSLELLSVIPMHLFILLLHINVFINNIT